MKSEFHALIGALLLIQCAIGLALPAEYEASFVKASLAYQEGNFTQATRLLAKLEAAAPNDVQVLELKALCLKADGQTESASQVYRDLYRQTDKKVSDKHLLYAFELGSLAVQSNKGPEAEKYLGESIRGGFNVSASRLLLGKYYFGKDNWEKAQRFFIPVSQSDDISLKSTAHLYLAQTHLKQNQLADTISSYVEALELSQDDPDELAHRVFQTADKELRAYDRTTLQAEIGISSGYDSNVLSVPNSTDSSGSSSPGSPKQGLNWRVSYFSSPIRSWHYLGTYQGSVNWNFNADTKSGQFFTHDVSNYLTRGSLKTFHYGAKVGGTGVMQYQTDAFRPYNLIATVGPFVKMRVLNSQAWLGAEAFFMPGKNYTDPTLSESIRRSGWDATSKIYLASATSEKFWNPSAYLSGTYMHPNGNEFQGTKANLDLVNSMYLSSDWYVAQSIGAGASWYSQRPTTTRTDQVFSVGVSGGYRVGPKTTLLASGQHLRNLSSESSYRYNRWSATLAASHRF